MITTLVLLGQVLELRARAKTGDAIRGLLALAPRTARRLSADGTDVAVAVAEVRPGDRLRVRPGDQIPVDGASRRIERSMNPCSPASPCPSRSAPGRGVGRHAQRSGSFVMQAERVGADTVLAQIVRLVAEARKPSTDPAARRRGFGGLRARGARRRGADGDRLGCGRSRAAAGVCAGERGGGAHHRLSVRARPRHADVGDGGDRTGARAGVRPAPPRRLEGLARVDTLVVDKTGTLTEEGRA